MANALSRHSSCRRSCLQASFKSQRDSTNSVTATIRSKRSSEAIRGRTGRFRPLLRLVMVPFWLVSTDKTVDFNGLQV